MLTNAIIRAIMKEQGEQELEYGSPTWRNYTWPEWLGVLVEEVGEVARHVNTPTDGDGPPHLGAMRYELVQVAAVVINMIEAVDKAIEQTK